MTVYRYNVALTVFFTCMTAAFAAFTLIFLIVFVRPFDLVGIMLTALSFLFVFVFLRVVLSRATIVANDRHIAAYMLGMQSRVIRWQDIKKIRKVRASNGYNYVDSFDVVDRMPRRLICKLVFVNLCGDIVFTQDISDLRGLLQQVNSFAQQHDIPLVVCDTEADHAKLRTKTGREWWTQALAKEEVRVNEF